jgi:hypothetical protein
MQLNIDSPVLHAGLAPRLAPPNRWTELGFTLNRMTILLVVAFMQVQNTARVTIK